MKQLLEEAKRIVRINSVTTNGNEELANYLADILQQHGLKSQMQQVTHSLEHVSKRQFNVLGIMGDPLVDKKTRKGLLLTTHLDTGSTGLPDNWTETAGDAFALTVKDGKLFGLGTSDAKLDFLCKLKAVEKFRERKLKAPIYLVGTCGEEQGMFGAKYLIKSMALNPKYVLVGHPTELKIVYAHKSLNLFRVSIGYQQVERDARGFNRRIDLNSFGVSSHAAYPHLGTNAIHQAVDFLQRATDSGFELRFTQLDGGDTVNKVPDRAKAEFYLTSHQFEDFKRYFRESVKARGLERAFRVELGGLGDMGVRFLPDALFPCINEVSTYFRELGARFEAVCDESFNPQHSTANFGLLRQRQGGVDMHFDLRLLPDQPPEKIEAEIIKGLQAIATRYPNLNIAAVRERLNPSLNLSLDKALMGICREAMNSAGIDLTFSKMSTSTEAAQFALAGYEAVVFGPGASVANSHSPNEYCLVEHLDKAVQFYQKLIEKVCL